MNEIKKIGNQNAPIRKMWKEQFDFMDIHLNAEPPVEILKSRRPKESEDKYILEYRLNNFRHTAKLSEFSIPEPTATKGKFTDCAPTESVLSKTQK